MGLLDSRSGFCPLTEEGSPQQRRLLQSQRPGAGGAAPLESRREAGPHSPQVVKPHTEEQR